MGHTPALYLQVRQLNSMGVEGIYAEDDAPEYAASLVAPSIAPGSIVAGSVVYGPPSYKSKRGSVVYVNGGIYSDPLSGKPADNHYDGDASEYNIDNAIFIERVCVLVDFLICVCLTVLLVASLVVKFS